MMPSDSTATTAAVTTQSVVRDIPLLPLCSDHFEPQRHRGTEKIRREKKRGKGTSCWLFLLFFSFFFVLVFSASLCLCGSLNSTRSESATRRDHLRAVLAAGNRGGCDCPSRTPSPTPATLTAAPASCLSRAATPRRRPAAPDDGH